jgi:hypothetical protein
VTSYPWSLLLNQKLSTSLPRCCVSYTTHDLNPTQTVIYDFMIYKANPKGEIDLVQAKEILARQTVVL